MKTNKPHIQESQRISTGICLKKKKKKEKQAPKKKAQHSHTAKKKILKTDGEKRNITFRRRKLSENLKYHHLHNLISSK